MRTTTLAAFVAAGTLTALAAPASAYAATTHTAKCDSAGLKDHLNKTDNGHGTPAAWADLSLDRYTGIKCTSPGHYVVLLTDDGRLRTRPGAGTPNGTGGTIAHRVSGTVHGVYGLKVVGQLAVPTHRDTALSSTEYVRQLFAAGATVTGGEYAWTYTTLCEKWVDSSKNNDGQGAAAGNITGKRCPKPTHSPTPSGSPTAPSTGGSSSTPTTMPVGAPQTGDGTGSGGANTSLMAAGGLVCLAGLGGGGLLWRRRRQH